MQDQKSANGPMPPEEPSLADRTDASIRQAESEFEAAKSELANATRIALQTKQDHDALHHLTAPIKNLAPLIRNEVSLLERLWRHAEERKGRLTDAVEAAAKELKSAALAREQLQRIGLYLPSEDKLHAKTNGGEAVVPTNGLHSAG